MAIESCGRVGRNTTVYSVVSNMGPGDRVSIHAPITLNFRHPPFIHINITAVPKHHIMYIVGKQSLKQVTDE